jgi:hypothetical protein
VEEVLPAMLDQRWWIGLGRVGLGRDDPRSLDRGGFLLPPMDDKPDLLVRMVLPPSHLPALSRPVPVVLDPTLPSPFHTAGHGCPLGSERQIPQVANGWRGGC